MTESLSETMHLYCICGMSAKQIAEELQVSVNTVYSRIKTATTSWKSGRERSRSSGSWSAPTLMPQNGWCSEWNGRATTC